MKRIEEAQKLIEEAIEKAENDEEVNEILEYAETLSIDIGVNTDDTLDEVENDIPIGQIKKTVVEIINN